MKIVQFKDGYYGIRSHWFFGWWFYSLENPNRKYKSSNLNRFPLCKTESLQRAVYVFECLNDKGDHRVLKDWGDV